MTKQKPDKNDLAGPGSPRSRHRPVQAHRRIGAGSRANTGRLSVCDKVYASHDVSQTVTPGCGGRRAVESEGDCNKAWIQNSLAAAAIGASTIEVAATSTKTTPIKRTNAGARRQQPPPGPAPCRRPRLTLAHLILLELLGLSVAWHAPRSRGCAVPRGGCAAAIVSERHAIGGNLMIAGRRRIYRPPSSGHTASIEGTQKDAPA